MAMKTAASRCIRVPARRLFSTAPTQLGDNWAPERLGRHMTDPLSSHGDNVEHRPGNVATQKHTFKLDYFRSDPCRKLLQVAFDGCVELSAHNGQYILIAKRTIKAGEIIERGVLRGVSGDALSETEPNPAIVRLGQDFMFTAGFPWGVYSSRPGPPFLPSGQLMWYQKSYDRYNIEVRAKESHMEGFEFDAVACEDIPEGTQLVRRIASPSTDSMPAYGDLQKMSEDEIEGYVSKFKELDLKVAANAGIDPDVVHEDALREHLRSTNTGAPIVNCGRSATLPHPTWGGFGVFATEPIRAGEVVESGLMGEVNGLDGNKCPYVFTWNSHGQRNTDGTPNRWCTGAGNAMFYNSDNPANCRMYRLYDHFRFLIVAKRDIKEGEELMHLYASSSWRKCFVQDEHLPKLLPVESGAE